MARQRPSLKSYISVNDEDEYKQKICDASNDDSVDNDGADETLTDDVFVSVEYYKDREVVSINNLEKPSEKKSFNKRWYSRKKCLAIAACAVVLIVVLLIVFSGKSTENDNQLGLSSGTWSKPSEYCLYYQEAEPYSFKSNPLKERCQLGSQFVKNYCPITASHHFCEVCTKEHTKEQLLPNFCFCDVGHQCKNDAPRKKSCSWCKTEGNCPCLNNGTCNCDDARRTGVDLYCTCPKGYGGKYCEIVPLRICEKSHDQTNLEQCDKSMNETCIVHSVASNFVFTCALSKDKEVDKRIANCSFNDTEINVVIQGRIHRENFGGSSSPAVTSNILMITVFIMIRA